MEFIINLQQCKHEWKPIIFIRSCHFIIGKGIDFSTPNLKNYFEDK
jgi:hypothetical protein